MGMNYEFERHIENEKIKGHTASAKMLLAMQNTFQRMVTSGVIEELPKEPTIESLSRERSDLPWIFKLRQERKSDSNKTRRERVRLLKFELIGYALKDTVRSALLKSCSLHGVPTNVAEITQLSNRDLSCIDGIGPKSIIVIRRLIG